MKVQLWLEGEEAFIDIRLAVVSRIHTPWITVGVIRVSPTDRMRLKRLIHTSAAMHIEEPALIDHSSHSGIARRQPLWVESTTLRVARDQIARKAGQSMPLKRIRSGWCAVQDFDGVAVEDGDDGAGEVGSC